MKSIIFYKAFLLFILIPGTLALDARASAEKIAQSARLLDGGGWRDLSVNDNPFVLKTDQATFSVEKALLEVEAEWDRLVNPKGESRTVLLSAHRLTPQLILDLDDAVCHSTGSLRHQGGCFR